MRAFPDEFSAALASRNGAGLVWLLTFTVSDVDYTLCQDAITVTPWSITSLPWIASWGELKEGVTSTLDDYGISELTVNLFNNPSMSPNLRALAKKRALHGLPVSVWLWVDGCAAPPWEMFRFRVRDIDLPTESQITLILQDESVRFANYFPGSILSRANYPSADPDDVSKTIPIIFGSLKKSRALAASAGVITTLAADITASQTSITVSAATGLSPGVIMMVDNEMIRITAVSSATLTITRGYNGTTAAAHTSGTNIWQWQLNFVYIVAGHAVDTISKIYGRIGDKSLDITAICTAYPSGNHPDYPGQAVVSIPGFVTLAQATGLGLADTSGVTNNTSVYYTIAATAAGHIHNQSSTSPNTINQTAGNLNVTYGGSTWVNVTLAPSFTNPGGTITSQSVNFTVHYGGSSGAKNLYIGGTLVQSGYSSGSYTWSGNTVPTVQVTASVTGTTASFTAGTRSVTYLPGGTTSSPGTGVTSYGVTSISSSGVPTGPITVSGNSTANTLVADEILVDVARNITAPPDVIGEILGTECQVVESLPAGYAFAGQISESKSALEWCHSLARQCRSYFRFVLGVPTLIVRPDSLTPVRSIAEARLSSGEIVHGQKLTDSGDVINTINLLYGRDWSQSSASYQNTLTGTDDASIAVYGTKEKPDLFKFDFVTDPAMAASLLAFYLRWYPWQRWLHTQDIYMTDAALEFADVVTLAFGDGEIGEVIEVGFSPGSGTNIDKIQLTVVE